MTRGNHSQDYKKGWQLHATPPRYSNIGRDYETPENTPAVIHDEQKKLEKFLHDNNIPLECERTNHVNKNRGKRGGLSRKAAARKKAGLCETPNQTAARLKRVHESKHYKDLKNAFDNIEKQALKNGLHKTKSYKNEKD